MAQPSITPAPTPPSTNDPANFASRADAFVAWMKTFSEEVPPFVEFLAASAQPVAITIPYTFSTTTTDSDPGAGTLRLGSATQNTATVIRADLADSSGATVTAVLDALDDSTSTVKGFLRLTAVGDGTKWLLFTVSAVATQTGYRNITVAPVAWSAASPFADGDMVSLTFARNGDQGPTGATGDIGPHALYEEQQSLSSNSATTHVTATQNTVALNTEVFDKLGIFSLSGNDIVFGAAGTYYVDANVLGIGVNGLQANLYNVTDSTVIKVGQSAYAVDLGSSYYTSAASRVVAEFTISSPKTIRLRAYTAAAAGINAMGQSASSGLTNVYAQMIITKKA